MKCICLTGFGSAPQQLDSVLTGAGVAPALPASCQPPMDIHAWHRQVLQLLASRDDDTPHMGLGRMWEHLASEIFLANAEAPVWGWADTASNQLLDFWHGFDSRVNFLLLFVRAETVVAAHIEQLEAQDLTLEQLLESWCRQHEALLTFGLRYPKRCVLVDASEALANPAALTELLRTKWKLPLSRPDTVPAVVVDVPNPVACFLADQLLEHYPRIAVLQQEIDASLLKLDAGPSPDAAAVEVESLITGFRQLLDRSSEQQQVQLLQEQCARLDELHRRTLEGYQQVQMQHTQRLNAANNELRAAKENADKHGRTIGVLEGKLHSSVEANELLLVQLHQVQEELELTVFEREALQKAEAELRIEVVNALEQKLRASTEENELLLVHLHQVQDELEALLLHSEEKQMTGGEQQKALQAQLAQMQKQREQLEQQHASLQAELKRVKANDERNGSSVKSMAQKLLERAEENELLLLQLHQVQEELEHHFQVGQDVQGRLTVVSERLRKMQERFPDYVEFGSMEVVRVDGNRATWQVKDVTLVGHDFAELSFDTVIEYGMAGFVFRQQENATQGFLDRWMTDEDELTLLPMGRAEQAEARLAAFLALNAGEWKRVHALADFLISLLAQRPEAIGAPEDFDAIEWLARLRALKAELSRFPPVLRFDQIKLKRQQINPDYEHLWLVLDNLSLGERQWPRFEFRLSCANVRPGVFGKNPKLEFPQVEGQASLASWFAESFDDFGDKLELRYAMPESMDLGVWHKLQKPDQNLLRQLVRSLPHWLRNLDKNGIQLNRPLSDWQDMAREMQRITAKHTGESKPARTVAAKPSVATTPHADSLMALLNVSEEESSKAKTAALSLVSGSADGKPVSKRKIIAARK